MAACDALTTELQPDPDTLLPDDIVSLSTDVAGGIAADGTSTVRLFARVPRNADSKTVTFTATAGTFVESAAKTVTVRALNDSAHADKSVASTLLRSDTAPAVAIVRATVGQFYDTVSVQFVRP